MARHFATLYALLVITLVLSSWGQDQFLQSYGHSQASTDDQALSVIAHILKSRLQAEDKSHWKAVVVATGRSADVDLDLIAANEIDGGMTLTRLQGGHVAYMQASGGESWALVQLDPDHVLAMKSMTTSHRSVAEWILTVIFYTIIALVVMIWVWPISRDLRILEKAAAGFGNKNWSFGVNIKPRSQVYSLAQTFRKMATRIDELIASHKDMSNGVAHEIKTPLSRMKFEIELANQSTPPEHIQRSLANIQDDIASIDSLVTATLNYAILERADVSLNIDDHDFTILIPAIVDLVRRDVPQTLKFETSVDTAATRVWCDIHLFESLLKNLLYNATRFATSTVRIAFAIRDEQYCLTVDDDGKGIPEPEQQRVFDSFVQLDNDGNAKSGFGLGLAIVKRIIKWHGGTARVTKSELGGASFIMKWPTNV